jgi:hypothetical protein
MKKTKSSSMYKTLQCLLGCGLLLGTVGLLEAQNPVTFDKYHNSSEVQQILQKFEQSNPDQVQIHTLATSPGKKPVTVLEIGRKSGDVPAIFVGANFEGNVPLATEGALRLAKMLLDSARYTTKLKWYILPSPNPDAAEAYFSGAKYERSVNDFAMNNDMDEAVNEDGFEDLNGDGLITQMRVKDLTGSYLVSKTDPRIMVRADAKKNERGEYKIYTEGTDNDGDGEYNEDGTGGINIGISFPHLFPKSNRDAGLWPGQSPETYGIMKFIYDHPNIVMVHTLGSSNFCLFPPKGGRKGDVNLESIKIPERLASRYGVDPNQSFTMNEVIELMKSRVPAGVEVTPALIMSSLGLGAAVNPLDDDLKFYTNLSDDYKKYLKSKNFSIETLDAAADKDGSFELWAYYQLGVPSFSMSLFAVPKIKEDKKADLSGVSVEAVEKMSADEFISLGEEKITSFLKSNNAPERFSAKGISEMLKSGKVTPKQLIEMLKKSAKPEKSDNGSDREKSLLVYSDKTLGGKGFVGWQKYKHPTLGEVEIGGFAPYLETTPRPEKIDSLLTVQLPWLLQLSKKLPDISVADQKITDLGAGIYRLEVFVENKGYLAYPISMGERNKQPAPVVLVIDGDVEFLEGLKRTPVGTIGGNQVKKLEWLVKTDKKPTISVKLESTVFGPNVKQIKIGG